MKTQIPRGGSNQLCGFATALTELSFALRHHLHFAPACRRMTSVCRGLPCLLLVANAALAQSAPPPVVQVDPVVVEETPLAADAAGTTRVRLDSTTPASTRTLGTVANRVANLHLATGGAGSFGDVTTLRGLPNTPYFSDPSVTLTFDDLPLGNTFTFPTGLFGFASAAVTRGPQGTASGRGGEAGAITLHSAEPGEHATGEVRFNAGNYETRGAAFELRTARSERADATVAAAFNEREGYIRNTALGRDVDDQQGWSAATRLRFRPTRTSELTLQLLGNRRRDGAQPLVPIGGAPFTVARGREGSTESDFHGEAFKAAFDTALGRLSSTTSRTEWRLSPYDNRLVLPPTLDSRIEQSQRNWNEELRLASGPRALLMWHVGAWFSDGKTHGEVNRGLVTPTAVIPIEASDFRLDSQTTALFGEITVPPNIGWRITAGLRAERVERDFDRGQRVPAPGRFTAQKTFSALLPKLAASYAFTNDTTGSVTIARGAKPGGWSAYTGNAALAGFNPEKVTTLEAGIDTAFTDKKLTLAARAFHTAIRNYQIERSFNAQDYLVINAPKARSSGGEIEAAWRPTPELSLVATFGLTDVVLREFTDPFTGVSYRGKRAPYAPEYEFHLGATYRAKAGFFIAAELVGTGETFFDETQSAAGNVAAHELANGRIGYEGRHWRVAFFAENITDEDYAALVIPGVRHAAPGAPRTWGIEAVLKW